MPTKRDSEPESGQQEQPSSPPDNLVIQTPSSSPTPKASIQGSQVFPVEFYKKAGISFCPECHEQKRTNATGKVFCPQGKPETQCPMLKAQAVKNAVQQG